jgi:hypothetical protein
MTDSAFTTLNLLSNTSCLDGESLKERRVLGGWSMTLSAGLSMSGLNLTLTQPFLAGSFITRLWRQSSGRTALHLRLSRAEIYAVMKNGKVISKGKKTSRLNQNQTLVSKRFLSPAPSEASAIYQEGPYGSISEETYTSDHGSDGDICQCTPTVPCSVFFIYLWF